MSSSILNSDYSINQNVRKWTGVFGLALVALCLGQFPLYMMGNPPSVYDGAALVHYMFTMHNVVFTRILLDLGGFVALMIFAAGFCQQIRRARSDYEWAGTLVFGAAAVWIGVTLVANGLEGAAALYALGSNADPSVVQALWMGTLLIYNGSIAFIVTGLFLGAAGYATFVTGVLPRWTGWVAYVGALLCAVCIPAIYFGAVNSAAFYNVGGWGPAIIANFPCAIWFLMTSILMIRNRKS